MILRICNPLRLRLACLLVAAGLVVVAGCSSTQEPRENTSSTSRQTRSQRVETTVPITLSNRRLIEFTVEVGDQSHQFLLYPSLDRSIVFEGENGLSTDDPAVQPRSGSEREVRLQSVVVGSVTFGPLEVLQLKRDQVKNFSTVLNRASLSSYTGILGYNFLRDKQLTVNYPDRRMRLVTADVNMSRAAREVLKPGKTEFEMAETAQSKRMITFQVGINGNHRGTFAVDLGIPVNLIDKAYLDRWNLQTLSSSALQQRFGSSSSRYDFVSVSRLWIGGRVFENALLRVRSDMRLQLGVDAPVILGNYFFTDKVVQINFPQRWLAIQAGDSAEE